MNQEVDVYVAMYARWAQDRDRELHTHRVHLLCNSVIVAAFGLGAGSLANGTELHSIVYLSAGLAGVGVSAICLYMSMQWAKAAADDLKWTERSSRVLKDWEDRLQFGGEHGTPGGMHQMVIRLADFRTDSKSAHERTATCFAGLWLMLLFASVGAVVCILLEQCP